MDSTNRSDCNVLSSNWEHILKCASYIPWGFHHGITCGHCMAVVLIGNFVHPELPFRLPPAISAITWSTWLSPPEVSHTCEQSVLLHAYLCCLYYVTPSKYSDCAVEYSLLLWWLIHWLTFTLSYMKTNVFSRFQTMRQSLSVAVSHVLHSFCSRNTVFYSSKVKLSLCVI